MQDLWLAAVRILGTGTIGLTVGCLSLASCFDVPPFRCEEDAQCAPGRCEESGFCSRVDPDCGSGYRYSQESGRLSGSCVDAGDVSFPVADVAYFDFEDSVGQTLANLAGTGINAQRECAVGPERFGNAALFDEPGQRAEIPDHPALFLDRALTVAAWVRRKQRGTLHPIFGDYLEGGSPQLEFQFDISQDDLLSFRASDGCDGEVVTSESESVVPAMDWHHVAVSWNGQSVIFYLDGVPAGTAPLSAAPCPEGLRRYLIGAHAPAEGAEASDAPGTFQGDLDELRVFRAALNPAELALIYAHDPETDGPRCGNGRVEEEEDCEGDSLCCDPSTCRARDGDSCGENGTCDGTLCAVPAESPTNAASLAAYYSFDNVEDLIVDERGPYSIDLPIEDPGAITSTATSTRFDEPTIASSVAISPDVIDCRRKAELTVELWIETSDVEQIGSLINWSSEGADLNFSLEQAGGALAFLVGSNSNYGLGTPALVSPADAVTTDLVQVVAVRRVGGERELYLNGAPVARDVLAGDFSNFTVVPVAVGGRPSGTTPWLGSYHTGIIFCRALSESEIAAHFASGPDPN